MYPVAEDILARTSSDSIAAGAVVFVVLLYLAIIVGVFYVYSRVVKKAGYPWPWVFIALVPVANIVMFCIFALKEWPIERELTRTRAALAVATGSPYPDPTVFGYNDYPVDYTDVARYSGTYQPQSGTGYPGQPAPAPYGAQYPAPDQAQGYAQPYSQPDATWQGQNGGLYGTPTDETGDGPRNPWAPKG